MGWLGTRAGLYMYVFLRKRKICSPWVFEPQSLGLPTRSAPTRYASLNDGVMF